MNPSDWKVVTNPKYAGNNFPVLCVKGKAELSCQ